MTTHNKMVHHLRALAPHQCTACSLIFQAGWCQQHSGPYCSLPYGTVLCAKCAQELECFLNTHYSYEHNSSSMDTHRLLADLEVVRAAVKLWLASHKPSAKPYHKVPKWMRSAIEQGMVHTNTKGDKVYFILSQNDVALKVEERPNERYA